MRPGRMFPDYITIPSELKMIAYFMARDSWLHAPNGSGSVTIIDEEDLNEHKRINRI